MINPRDTGAGGHRLPAGRPPSPENTRIEYIAFIESILKV